MPHSNPDEFDGYRKWLGITDQNRPPTHYELLKLDVEEADPDVIQSAAEQRRQYVESKRGLGHDDVVAEILMRIDEAQITLLTHEMRRDYDRQLARHEKRRNRHPAGFGASRSRRKSSAKKVVGEEPGIIRTFAGIMAIVCVAFGVMAWFSFRMPWSKQASSDQEQLIQTPAAETRLDVMAGEMKNTVSDRVGELQTFNGQVGGVWSVAFSPDGKLAASGQGDIPGKGEIGALPEYPLVIWNLQTGQQVARCEGHTGTVRAIAFSPDGERCASGSWDKTVRIWDVKTGRQLQICEGHGGFITGGIVFTLDGQRIISGSVDKTARMWDSSTGKELKSFSAKGQVHCLAMSPDGRQLLTGETFIDQTWGQNRLTLWDIETGEPIRTFKDLKGRPHIVAFTPDGGRALSATGLDYVMQLWDVATGNELRSFEGHSCCITPDGNHALATRKDNGLILWELATGRELEHFQTSDRVMCIAVSNDGRKAVTGSVDQTMKLWGLPKY